MDIPAQPPVHRLPRHPIPPRHIRDRGALIQDFQHRPVPLLGHTQLHQHTRPSLRPPIDHRQAPRQPKAGNSHGVSCSYRNYCRPPTGTASATCHPGTGTHVSMINRNRTSSMARVAVLSCRTERKRLRFRVRKPALGQRLGGPGTTFVSRLPRPWVVKRRGIVRGAIMVRGQKIQVAATAGPVRAATKLYIWARGADTECWGIARIFRRTPPPTAADGAGGACR
jgi:hypothetical protein